MTKKPTYEELEHRVKELEEEFLERKKAEEALRESEERYRSLLEASPDPIVVYDIEGRATYVNSAFIQTFGWSHDEVLGQRIDFVPQENWPETKDAIERMLQDEKIQSLETRRFTKDGKLLDIQLSSSLFKDRYGKPVGNIVILRDATERKQAEAEETAELNKFQALYDFAVAMTSQRSLDENLSLVVEKSRKLLGTDTSFIALCDETAGDVYMHSLSGINTDAFKRMRTPIGLGLGGKVAKTGKGYIVEDYFQEVGTLLHDIVRAEGLISGIAAPVQIGQMNLGVLYVFNRTKTSFSKLDLDTLSFFGNLAAVHRTQPVMLGCVRQRRFGVVNSLNLRRLIVGAHGSFIGFHILQAVNDQGCFFNIRLGGVAVFTGIRIYEHDAFSEIGKRHPIVL